MDVDVDGRTHSGLGFIPTSRLFRNQGVLAQVFLKYVFNNPPLATALPTAGTFTCEMVLGEEKGRTTGRYYCGPPDYQPEGEPTFLGFVRGRGVVHRVIHSYIRDCL